MKNLIPFLFAIAAFSSGCLSSKSPYDYMENWLIREDAVRPFAVPVDVLYVQDRLYFHSESLPEMQTIAMDAVGREKLAGIARVFSPLVASEEDVEKAVEWYIKHHNGTGRPFALIGEGEGGALLKSYAEENAVWLKEKGLVANFYSKLPDKDFVSEVMIDTIKRRAVTVRYRRQWKREMPVNIIDEGQAVR